MSCDKVGVVDGAETRGHLHHTDVGDRLVLILGGDIAEDDSVFIRAFVQISVNWNKTVRFADAFCVLYGLALIDAHLADVLRRGFLSSREHSEHLEMR